MQHKSFGSVDIQVIFTIFDNLTDHSLTRMPCGARRFSPAYVAPLHSLDPLHNKEETLRIIAEKGGDYLVGTKDNTSKRLAACRQSLVTNGEAPPF